MKKRGMMIGISLLSILIITISLFKWEGTSTNAEELTAEEATKLVEERYKGKVQEIKQDDDQYVIVMDRGNQHYEIMLGTKGGEVHSFTKKGSNEQISKPEGLPNEGSKTENEIKKDLQPELNGEIVFWKKINMNKQAVYKVITKNEAGKEILFIDVKTGEIISRKTIHYDEHSANVSLTEDDAIKAALQEVKGNVSDVDLEGTGNQVYYLVEIEKSDSREATVQIHGITGEVMSITWDD